MKKILIFTFILAIAFAVNAQNGAPSIAGARGAAMGNASVAFTDINSAFSNQAGLAYLTDLSVTVGAESRFLLSELNSFMVAAAYPTKSGTFGLDLNYFGSDAYNEQKIGLAYARRLFSKMTMGAQLDMINTRIPEYGNKSLFTFELGFHAQLLKQVFVGAHVFSPIRLELVEDEYIPTVFRLGLAYKPSNKLTVTGEVEKDIDFAPNVKAGIEYAIIESFFIRFGANTNPALVSFGIGYAMKNGIGIDVSSSYHQPLGFSPSVGITYDGSRKK